MSLLPHLVAADVRRLRVTIALWVSVVLVETIVGQTIAFLPQSSSSYMTLLFADRLLWFATTLLSWALVPFILQLHPAVGSTAFWMTRPIPARALVLAKLLVLMALFTGVPVALEQVVMALHGVPAADMTRVGIQNGLYRSLLLALLAAAAALTPNLPRFALLCGAVLFAFALLPIVLMGVEILTRAPDAPRLIVGMTFGSGMDVPLPQADATFALVGSMLLVATGVLAVAVQYQRRRARDSAIVLVAGFVLAFVISSQWRWQVLRAPVDPPGWALSPDALQVRANVAAMRFNPPDSMHGIEPWWTAHTPLMLTPAAAGWIATARVAAASFTVGGTTLSTRNEYASAAVLPDSGGQQPGPIALQRVLDVERVLEWGMPSAPDRDSALTVQVPPEVVVRAGGSTGVLNSEFIVDIAKLSVASVMPLGRGSFQDGADSVTILDVKETPTGALVYLRVVTVRTMLDRRPRPAYWHFLRNRRQSEAIRGRSMGAGSHVAVSAFAIGFSGGGSPSAFSASSYAISFDGRDPTTPDARVLITREWLRDAEFVVLRATHDGSVRRTLEIRDFPLGR